MHRSSLWFDFFDFIASACLTLKSLQYHLQYPESCLEYLFFLNPTWRLFTNIIIWPLLSIFRTWAKSLFMILTRLRSFSKQCPSPHIPHQTNMKLHTKIPPTYHKPSMLEILFPKEMTESLKVPDRSPARNQGVKNVPQSAQIQDKKDNK